MNLAERNNIKTSMRGRYRVGRQCSIRVNQGHFHFCVMEHVYVLFLDDHFSMCVVSGSCVPIPRYTTHIRAWSRRMERVDL